MSSDLFNPDEGTVEAISRVGQYLINLPRLNRQGMKHISLPVPTVLADKLSKGTCGSATQAIAVLARWVLEDMHKQDTQLIAEARESGFSFSLAPRGGSGIAVKVNGHPGLENTRSMLASLPPSLHEQLRSLGEGSIRLTLLALFQYGLEQLDKSNRLLQLIPPATQTNEGKAAMLLVDGSGSCSAWIKEALPVMQWLGYRVKVAQEQDMAQEVAGVYAGMLVVGKPNIVVQHWLSRQKQEQVLHYEPVQDAAGTFSPEGALSSHKRPEFMSGVRSAYCVQCDRGVSVIEESECRRDASKMHGRMYCRTCRSLFGASR